MCVYTFTYKIKIVLYIRFEPDFHHSAYCDCFPVSLYVVFYNIIFNDCKVTPCGPRSEVPARQSTGVKDENIATSFHIASYPKVRKKSSFLDVLMPVLAPALPRVWEFDKLCAFTDCNVLQFMSFG